ncbi:MAG: zinc ribbon domain-containing protein [Alistipes sp.]|nr:zinc ribbon domain-containing protein [Candidatus Alistipes equi]
METKSAYNVQTRTASVKNPAMNVDSGEKCPACGGTISSMDEFCLSCGHRLVGWCTFCGAKLLPEEKSCPECGVSVEGIRCPECGTLNQRAFCRKCNSPLTKAAVRVQEKARQDPKFQQAQQLCLEASKMEESILDGTATQEEITEYKHCVKTINELLGELLPPQGSTPQQQRNYFSARKIAVIHKHISYERTGWICNWCGCRHTTPAECSRPDLGGQWLYSEVETQSKTYEYEQ